PDRKTIAPGAEEARGANDAATRNVDEVFFRIGFRPAVDVDGIARIASFIGSSLLPIENVIGADENYFRPDSARSLRHVNSPLGVDRRRQCWIELATIHVG